MSGSVRRGWARQPTRFPREREAFVRSFPPHKRLAMRLNWAALEDALPQVRGRTCDLGCGLQPYAALLRSRATQLIAIDWSRRPQAVNPPHVLADVSRGIPLRDGCIDTVLASHVLEHLREPDIFLRECWRILAPGGRVIILVPFLWQVHEAPHDHYRFTRYALERHLGQAGFTDIEIVEGTGGWGTIALLAAYLGQARVPLHLRLLRRPLLWLVRLLAGPLDAARPTPEYTAGYRVSARRPL